MSDTPTNTVANLADTYATNALSIKLGNTQFIMRPTIAGATDAELIPANALGRFPMHIISAWNPTGMPTTLEVNGLWHSRLEVAIAKKTHDLMTATYIGLKSSWFEQAIAVTRFTDKQAIALGKRFNQAAVVRIDRDGWHILSTDLHEDFADTITLGWRLTPRNNPNCALRVLEEDTEPCKMHGGPWGSAAISAAVTWTQHRRVAIATLGCGMCETRSTAIAEQGLILNPTREWCIASRHGAAISRPKVRPKIQILHDIIGGSDIDD